MTNRSDLLLNLNRISHITEAEKRKPLANDEYLDSNVESESESSPDDELVELTPSRTSISSRLRSRPSDLTEKTVSELDTTQLQRIFGKLKTKSRERRSKKAEGQFRLSFADITSVPVTYTIFDAPYFKQLQFYGFYILFWLGTGFLFLKELIHGYFEGGPTIFGGPVFKIFSTGLVTIAITDLIMYLSIYVSYLVQYLCLEGHIQWYSSGWVVQSIYETVFGVFWLLFICKAVMKDQWIGKVFLVLHMFVLLMKMHSYAFYNGYLWSVLRELQFSENYLTRLQSETAHLPDGYTVEHTRKLLLDSIAFCKFELLHQSGLLDKAKDIEFIEKDSENLCEEWIKFPSNITMRNFFDYTMYPTLVYELSYHRTKKIRWFYVFEKASALIGVIFLMLIVAERKIYPLVQMCNEQRLVSKSITDKAVFYILMLLDMIPPFMMEYLFVFYLIWDTILNLVAELSRFADRDFYGPWWSCTDWSEYARLWNKPVHRFLLRHVYHSLISAFEVSKVSATLITFTISSIVHELVMYVIFERLRGYLFYFQMSQIPLVFVSRTRFMKDRKVLGNVICWFGFVSGPAIICTLYLVY